MWLALPSADTVNNIYYDYFSRCFYVLNLFNDVLCTGEVMINDFLTEPGLNHNIKSKVDE